MTDANSRPVVTREAWNYAILLIVLFAIATVGVLTTLAHVEERLSIDDYRILAAIIWSLTMGFMLIAGAFGLWAIQFSAAAEGRRRVGRFVDAMDYLRDGLVTVDRRGRITGANPSAKSLAQRDPVLHQPLRVAFPCLSDNDVTNLLDPQEPAEVEGNLYEDETIRVVRFRSQPSEGLSLILLSDVTAMNQQRTQTRQAAQLQLIGEIARGVAHDFNNLLCGIAGYASLLPRLGSGSPDAIRSVKAIAAGAEKGIVLAAHLLELAKTGSSFLPAEQPEEPVRKAANLLQDALPDVWRIEHTENEPMLATAMTPNQLEQVVLNLGLLAAEEQKAPGILRVVTGRPGNSALFQAPGSFAGFVVVSAMPSDIPFAVGDKVIPETSKESGMIRSVVRSLIEETGGALHTLAAADGSPVYRVALPRAATQAPVKTDQADSIPDDLAVYIRKWTVLLACSQRRECTNMDLGLSRAGIHVERVDNIISTLARIEEGADLDVIVIDRHLLGQEAAGLLRAIAKLRPSAGTLVLSEDPRRDGHGIQGDVVFASVRSDFRTLIGLMMEAKSLASRRKPGDINRQ